ncbi:MAG: two-component regulator propeller domain-containing protein, partial [Bacteroidota bacterium]
MAIRLIILFCSCLLSSSITFGQKQGLKFKRFSTDHGLSDIDTYTIAEDKQGFLWFGTSDGLNKFDGYTFAVYRHDPKIEGSLSNNTIWTVYADRLGRVWAGTDDGGVNRYDQSRDAFVSYKHDPKDPNSLSTNEVTAIYHDTKGRLWVGTDGGGVNLLDEKTGKFTHFLHDAANPKSLGHNVIRSLGEDRHGNLCVGTDGAGLAVLDFATKTFTHYQHDPTNPQTLNNDLVHKVFLDHKGNLWVGTVVGLNRYDESAKTFVRYYEGSNGLSGSFVKGITEDAEGNIWVSFINGALSIIHPKDQTIAHYRHDPDDLTSLATNDVFDVYADHANNVWLATGKGVCLKEGGKQKFFRYKRDAHDSSSLHSNDVLSFTQDNHNQLWVSTKAGLEKFDKQKGTFELYPISDQQGKPLVFYNHDGKLVPQMIMAFAKDRQSDTYWLGTPMGLLWVDKDFKLLQTYLPNANGHNDFELITQDKKGNLVLSARQSGLFFFNVERRAFIPIAQKANEPGLQRDIFSLHFDEHGTLWVGTALFGLYKLDLAKGTMQNFHKDLKNKQAISDNFIFSIFQDSQKRFWLGTRGGLNLMDRTTNTFISYRKSDGLPNDIIYGVREDRQKRLWLSTNYGLSRFDPQTKIFRNYTVDDGLQSNQFKERCYFKSKEGDLYFGGFSGFNVFNPLKVEDNKTLPPVYITAFQIFNKPVVLDWEGNQDSPLKQNILDTKSLTLSYKQSVFSFEFVALNYVVSANNQYAYKMEGFDKDWN